ncbi:MAG TPA: PDZ domain-containing protein [Pyrinomonadaceae bacterium]|nr:PDZ domain-containing protein [Pyrinomonadaceae bacterium]
MLSNFSDERVLETRGLVGVGLWRGVRTLACVAFLTLLASGVSAQATQTARPVRRTQTLPSAPTAPAKPVAAPRKPQEAMPPVIAVVHRLSGWKLRTLLTPPDAPVASNFDENFVRTNIVAGYIMPDGRTVVARLPQAEAEMLNLAAAFRPLSLPSAATTSNNAATNNTTTNNTAANSNDAELSLVRPDGSKLGARFVGLDASTGLSLLEADEPLLAPAAEPEIVSPVVGQRVRVIAPVRAAFAPVAPPAAAPPAPAATPRPDFAPVGDEGVLYMNMSEEAGQLREVKRSPSGKPMEMTVEVKRVSPEWAGGVALSETGTLVGIVEESDARAARLLSAESVRGAARRVRERRASVPQPWLGARGDALAFAPLEQLLAGGWTREQARSLLTRQRGVLLTSVAPGTPAAHAGLRPGDVVSRIGHHDVRNIEDMSLLIKELGGNTLANFTVLRAESPPLNLAVRLSESPSPGLDTARAELRAARADLRSKQLAISVTEEDIRSHEAALRYVEAELKRLHPNVADAARDMPLAVTLKRVQSQLARERERMQKLSAEYEQARQRLSEAERRYRAASESYSGLAVRPLLAFGLEAVRFAPSIERRTGARPSGLLVMSVRQGSAAAGSQIQVGDIIESINGQLFSDTNWNFNLPADFDTELSLGILRAGEKLSFNLSRNPQ